MRYAHDISHDTVAERARSERGLTLIELLVGVVIASILSSMLFVTWFALNNSYSYSVNSSKARDEARTAMSRVEREIRAAENIPGTASYLPWQSIDLKAEPMMLRTRPWTLLFTSTFNEKNNASPGTTNYYLTPAHLVMYRVYYDPETNTSELWRYEDLPNAAGTYSGSITGVQTYSGTEPTTNGRPSNFNVSEKTAGEGATLLMKHVANCDANLPSGPVPMFNYGGYFDGNGTMTWDSEVIGKDNRINIRAVNVHILVDLNPKAKPVYIDLMTTAQLRNQRVF
jgi:prepilin-type N-terminal cleavage/methylation domain-containing protein